MYGIQSLRWTRTQSLACDASGQGHRLHKISPARRTVLNLAPSWAARLRQWWDELFTGRAERTLASQTEEWKAEAYRWRAKCEQMEKALMLATPSGSRYVISQSPTRQEEKVEPRIPQSWAEMQQLEELEPPDDVRSLRATPATESEKHSENTAAIGR